MKYQLSPIANEVNGPIAGLTFVKHQKSPYVRGNALRTLPATSLQTSVRSAYGHLVELWRSLAQFQIDAWNSRASLYNLSGFNLFVKDNLSLELSDQATNITPIESDLSGLESPFFQWCQKDDRIYWGCMVPPAPAIDLFYYYRDAGSHDYTYSYNANKNSSSLDDHISFWNGANYAGYVMDGDIPTRFLGGWPDMTAVSPGNISQGVADNGLEYNKYASAGGYNVVAYQGSPNFHYDQDWAISFWVNLMTTTPGSTNQFFIIGDPGLGIRKIDAQQGIQIRSYGNGITETYVIKPVPSDTWTHIFFENDRTNDQYRYWLNGHLIGTQSKTGSGETANARDYTFGGCPYTAQYKDIGLGNLTYFNSTVESSVVWYEAKLRSADFRSRRAQFFPAIYSDIRGHQFSRDNSLNVSPDSGIKSAIP